MKAKVGLFSLFIAALVVGCEGTDGAATDGVMQAAEHDHYHVHAKDAQHEHTHPEEDNGGHTHDHEHQVDQ